MEELNKNKKKNKKKSIMIENTMNLEEKQVE
jgi:hypothetical protein